MGRLVLIETRDVMIDTFVAGPAGAPCVLLVHGWPDDASTWSSVAANLNDHGFRTVRYMHRGFGATRFRSASTARTANVGILALDAIELLDALGIESCFVAGHDWGSSVAEALAVGWPERILRIAMLSSPSRLGGLNTPDFAQARRYWYQWFQATQRGADAIAKDPVGFARIMWQTWSPTFDEAAFERVAPSFRNPDWVAVTLHSYRSRWGEAELDPRSLDLETAIATTRSIATPTIFFQGTADGVTPPEGSEHMHAKFTGSYERVLLEGVGHFPTRESPDLVSEKLIAHFQAARRT